MSEIITPGIPDGHFIRGNVPITKEEIRALTISKLRLNDTSTVLDIGAGTGSVSIEIARLLKQGRVYAIEKKGEALELINENIKKFQVHNVEVHEGEAPGVLDSLQGLEFDRAFIGGSKGKLIEILEWIDERLPKDGRIAVNAVTLDTLNKGSAFLRTKGYVGVDIIQVSISRCEETGGHLMFRALNPVFIISGQKE